MQTIYDTNMDYYLNPTRPDYRGEARPATMQVWIHRGDGQPPGLAFEPVLLYPSGTGSSPGGHLVSPVARLADHASAAAHQYHRRNVGGWSRPIAE